MIHAGRVNATCSSWRLNAISAHLELRFLFPFSYGNFPIPHVEMTKGSWYDRLAFSGSARNYANIKSYLETGKRHGYHVSELIKRALGESYITIAEMKLHDAESED